MRPSFGLVRSLALNALKLSIRFIARTDAIAAPCALVFSADAGLVGHRGNYLRTDEPSSLHLRAPPVLNVKRASSFLFPRGSPHSESMTPRQGLAGPPPILARPDPA